uniref:Endosome-lysosome associated apoptosis and autophagy regulator 1 n=1 Tax=Takifugu rubripes TaxID=31033 RepID=H2UWY3_TAKRU
FLFGFHNSHTSGRHRGHDVPLPWFPHVLALTWFGSPCLQLCETNICVLWLQSDYHYEYTECDVFGSRWRVAVPNKADICTGLPDPVHGTQCAFSCSEGEFLDMQSQRCKKCAVGTYSLGTGIAFDEWDSLPSGFSNQGVNPNDEDIFTNCSSSTWTPKGDYISSNTDECTATLFYAVNLKKPGIVSFEYVYPDEGIYFEFFVQNDQCQSTDSASRWMKISETKWSKYLVCLNLTGNNVLYWRTTGYVVAGSEVKPVLLRNIGISGVSYTSECFQCKPGTYSEKPGSARCTPCPVDTYSNKGATVCLHCDPDKYSEAGSGTCKPRPACTVSDYFYTHTPCDSKGKTQLMYKWIQPKICSETVNGAVKLPASGEKQTCPPCNPGFFFSNSSTCEPCDQGSYSNGTACIKCPVGTEPVLAFEYKWWNTMPKNMRSYTLRQWLSHSENTTGWEVAGEYVYTTPGDQDVDNQMLTLKVPGYRLPQSVSKASENSELSRISFVFETTCSANCTFSFLAGYNQWLNDVVEWWRGSQAKQSYSFLIQKNTTDSFTWSFQRTGKNSEGRKHSGDMARIYSIHIANVIGGVASQCRRCAVNPAGFSSACVPCPPGHYMVNGTGVCKSCPPNTIIRADQSVGVDACIPCGPNTERNEVKRGVLDVLTTEGERMHYDFSALSNITSFQSGPRFTNKGLRYFHHFNIGLCGEKVRKMATCVDNVTESGNEVKGYVCQSTAVPSGIRSQSLVSTQPVLIGDALIGVTTDTTLSGISSPDWLFPSATGLRDVIFYFGSSESTLACKEGRSATVRLRCNPTVTAKDLITLPSNCSEGTCDGCTFHFLWESQYACPRCTTNNYRAIVSACIQGIQRTTYVWQQPLQCFGGESLPPPVVSACVSLDFWLRFGVSTGTIAAVLLMSISCYFWKKTRKLQYKYSKLVMNSSGKECDLPTADSCAIMEGEDAEDDVMYLSKKPFFSKIRRTSDGFDSVPLKSSSSLTNLELLFTS